MSNSDKDVHEHFVVRCRVCLDVLHTCVCAANNKPDIFVTCASCSMYGLEAEPAHYDWEDKMKGIMKNDW